MTATHTIAHRIELDVPVGLLYAAIAEPEGLANWWTPMTEPRSAPHEGSVLRFRFGDGKHGPDMRVDRLEPNKKVVWRCVAGPWEGHRFTFEVTEHPRGSVLRFYHRDWSDMSDFYMHCNAKWAYFLAVSLKRYLETGQGAPHPQDPSI